MNYNLPKVSFHYGYGTRYVNFSLLLNIFLKVKFIRTTVVEDIFSETCPAR